MPVWVADYLADTTHLDTLQHGTYWLLMLRYWIHGALPDDDVQLAKITGLAMEAWERERPVMLALFKGGHLKHKRIDKEIKKAKAISRKRSKAAKSRGKSMPGQPTDNAGKSPPTTASANAQQKHPKSEPETKSVAKDAAADSASLISESAWKLSSELAVIAGHPADPQEWPPGWSGSPMRVQTWLGNQWHPDAILAAARGAAARKPKGSIKRIDYFEGAIADEVERQAKPLPKGQPVLEKANATPTNDPSRTTFQGSRDEFRVARAKLKRHVTGGDEPPDEGGGPVG